MNSCSRISPVLTRYLIEGGELPTEAVEHVRHCVECAETIHRAQLLGDLLESADDEAQASDPQTPNVAHEVIAAVQRRRRLRIGLAAAIAAIAIATWYVTVGLLHVQHRYAIWVIQMVLFAGPLIIAAMTAGLDDTAPSRVYKRMRGRQASGICQGLSEAYRIPVWVVRMAFFALIFLKGAGVVLYLLLDVLLPIHPDDRATLLRFRIARWWKRRAVASA